MTTTAWVEALTTNLLGQAIAPNGRAVPLRPFRSPSGHSGSLGSKEQRDWIRPLPPPKKELFAESPIAYFARAFSSFKLLLR